MTRLAFLQPADEHLLVLPGARAGAPLVKQSFGDAVIGGSHEPRSTSILVTEHTMSMVLQMGQLSVEAVMSRGSH